MSDFFYYAAILLFPVLSFLILEPVGARWGAQHKSFYPPPDIKARSERNGRYVWIIKYVTLSFLVIWLAMHFSLISQTFGPHSNEVLLSVTWGILGGMFLFLFRAGYRIAIPRMLSIEYQEPFLKGPTAFWLILYFLGGFSEELWRGFCIAATRETQRDIIHAIIWISISFAAAHLGGIPGRIHGEVPDAAFEAITGVFLGCLFIFSGSVISTFVASVFYYTGLFYYLRRLAALSPQQTLNPSPATQTPLGSRHSEPSMRIQPAAGPRSPKCPDCGSGLSDSQIDIVNPFECPACRNQLFVSPEYNKRIRRACIVLSFALGIIFAFVRNNIILFLWGPVIGFFLVPIAPIFCKRFFPPKVEDYASHATRARYLEL